MEARKEKVKRAVARRRMRDFSWGVELGQPPQEKNNRKFFYIAAGSIVVALVAFLCGVQMGKSLSELRRSEDPASPSRVQDRKGQAPPFRLMERGKENQPGQEAKIQNSDAGEREGVPPQPTPKVSNGKASESMKDSVPEEGGTAPPKPKYTLQVAALNNPAEAQDLVNQLKKKGYDAYLVTGSAAAKGTLHRVRIGNYQSLQEARQFALIFEKKENMKPIISSLQNQ
jgi:cell division septation protein DedD